MLEIKSNGTIEDVLKLIELVPEFESIHNENDFKHRFEGNRFLILIAYCGEEPAGFKVGYDRYKDGSFYNWLEAVLPRFRRKNIAQQLLNVQEKWANENGFNSIKVKTRNKFPAMLQFLIKNQYLISTIIEKDDIHEHRIFLEKSL